MDTIIPLKYYAGPHAADPVERRRVRSLLASIALDIFLMGWLQIPRGRAWLLT